MKSVASGEELSYLFFFAAVGELLFWVMCD